MLSPALVLMVSLAASPGSSSPAKSSPEKAKKAPSAEPELEVVIPARMIEELLAAASPFEKTLTREVAVLGFAKTVNLDLTLTRPRVKVSPAGIEVTFDYDLRGPGGISSRGRATPRLELVAVEGKGILEGRLTGAKLAATGGLEIPVEDLVEPVQLPAGAGGPLAVGDRTLDAQAHARRVVLEEGRVRVLGDWEFKKAPKETPTTEVRVH